MVRPSLSATRGADGFYVAHVVIAHPAPMRGIPVQLTVTKDGESATVYSATGLTARLPLAASDAPGIYTITATELLSGLSVATTITLRHSPDDAAHETDHRAELARFAARRTVPLTIALTPTQMADPKIQTLAAQIAAFYKARGRTVTTDTITPNHVVLSLQPLNGVQSFPRWRTVATDLVLIGRPSDNPLLLDQARGFLLPDVSHLGQGRAVVAVTYSPFVGECDVLNILADDTAGLSAGVQTAAKP